MKRTLGKSSLLLVGLGCAVGVLPVIIPPAANADVPVNGGAQSDSGSIDLKLGPFDFAPRVDAGVTYDDNILFDSASPESDLIFGLNPGVQAVAGDKLSALAYQDAGGNISLISPDSLVTEQPGDWPGKLLVVDESPLFKWYTEHGKNDYIGNLGRVNFVLPETRYILGASLDYDSQPITIVEAGQLTGQEVYDATLSGDYFVSDKTALESAVTLSKVDYQAAGLGGYTEWKDVSWANYQWTGLFNIGAGFTGGLDDLQGGQTQSYGQILVRTRYAYTQKVSFDASAGGEMREYGSDLGSRSGFVFNLGGQYQMLARTVVNLNGGRGNNPTSIGGQNYTVTSMSLSVDQGVTDRVGVRLETDYSHYDPVVATRTASTAPLISSDYYAVRIGLSLKITPHWSGGLSYFYRTLLRSQLGDVEDSQVAMTLSWKY